MNPKAESQPIGGSADLIWLRHRQRLLQTLLVAMFVLFAANAAYRWTMDHSYRIPWPAYGVLAICFVLNRLGRSHLAATITVLLIPAFVAVSAVAPIQQRHPVFLGFLVLDLILASLLLSWAATAGVVVLNVGLLITVSLAVPNLGSSGVVPGITALCAVAGCLILLGLRFRDRVETERRQELLASDTRKSVMLETAMDAIFTIDGPGRIVELNPAAERMFGLVRGQAIGREMAELIIPPSLRAAHRAGLARYLAAGPGPMIGRRLEMRGLRSDGTEFPCELAIAAAELPSGPVFTGFIRDLSERKAAEGRQAGLEGQLRQSQKMQAIGQLAGGVAHDFNNMLQVISGYLLIAIDDLKARAPEVVPDLTEAAQAADQAGELTKRLLAFSRRQVLALEVVEFNEVLTSILSLVHRALGEQIELEFHPGSGLPTVKVDRSQVQQVVLNLCLNARDAMPSGGRLILETELVEVPESFVADHPWATAGSYLAMVVADSGTGMSPETERRIFEPFFTTKENQGGTGLGLAVVYGIVEQHRGFIRVDTEVGEGTSFRVYWPVSGEPSLPRPAEDGTAPPGGTETILVAEDADAIRTLAERTLGAAGYRVITAANGKEAVKRFQEDPSRIDLVLLDVVMPKLGGRAAFELMRAAKPGLRGMFLSGYSASEISEEWLLAQGCELLAKPITSQVLLRRVRAALDRA